eukprot:4708960-Pyramimonas_sp.AAC.1
MMNIHLNEVASDIPFQQKGPPPIRATITNSTRVVMNFREVSSRGSSLKGSRPQSIQWHMR